VLLYYLAKSKLLILLFYKHNKYKCSYFWTRKRGCFYPSHIRGPWHQNKWSVYILSGTCCWNRRCCPISVQFLGTSLFSSLLTAGQCTHRPIGPWDSHVTAARGSSFHCCQSVASEQPRPQPCWLQVVEYDAGPCLSGEGARRWRPDWLIDWAWFYVCANTI